MRSQSFWKSNSVGFEENTPKAAQILGVKHPGANIGKFDPELPLLDLSWGKSTHSVVSLGGKKSRNQRKKGKDEETKPRCKEKVLIKILRLNFKFQDEISESLTDPETRMTNEYANIPKYMQMRQFQAPSLQRHRNPCEAQQVGSFSSPTPALPANSSTLESFPPPAKVCLEAARGS